MAKNNKNILVIPDAHARAGVSQRRFDALAKFIIKKKPDIIVCIGDWADMPSLSSYDKGTLHAEGRRYVEDIQAANDALERVMVPVNAEVERLVRNKKRRWNPRFIVTLGNHENRITRAQNEDPSLKGAISLDDINFKTWGWEVIPFLETVVVQGIAFKHFFTSGVMGRPIGGVNHARTLVAKNYMSSVCGHSHLRDYWEDVRADGQRIFGLCVGCYDEGDHHYTSEQMRWWSGLVMLHDAEAGSAEPAFYSTDYILRNYL